MAAAIAAVAAAIIGAGASAKSASNANKTAKGEQQRVQQLVDNWLKQYGGYQSGVKQQFEGPDAPLHDTLFGPQVTTSDTNSLSEVTPTITPQMTPLVNMATKAFAGRLQRGSSLPPGYAQSQERNIIDSFATQDQADKDLFARQNKPYTEVGSPVATARANKLADFQAGLPLMERNMNTEDLKGASDLAATFGKGSKTSASSHNTVTAPPNIAAILQYFGLMAPPQPPIVGAPSYTSPLTAGLGGGMDMASIIALLMKQYQKPASSDTSFD